ncbi:GNAT family N-acetyltransferase [Jeotgalibacillus proteolyticus]|uniref:GNAT family N-acetyltransferase n=1 Tax=Jeotgalibacillus proteolyticus TaxID=2082395 RepID=UPI003CEE7377
MYDKDKEIFWIELEQKKIGLIVIHDSSDTIPLFDIRLEEKARGKGIGELALKWLTQYIFSHPVKKIRIEAYTRSDNTAMRKTLHKCGFVKEGYLRQAWEHEDGSVFDSVCYAIIRNDWENQTRTPIKLDDLPY